MSLGDTLTLTSQVTGALWPMEATVYHLHSARGDASTTVSQLLLGLPRPVPVATVSAMLDGVVKRIYEVVSLQAQGAAPSALSRGWRWGAGAGQARRG